jgi:Ca-activated chloride channel family protein
MLRIALCLALTFACVSAFGDGMIFPEPVTPDQPFSVDYHRVTINIVDRVAKTAVDQLFTNSQPRDLEATYMFPLPEGAAINRFSMYVEGKELAGTVLGKDEARRIYESIVRKQRDPGLLEYVGEGMFRARVYPIPANGEKRVTLSYEQVLQEKGKMVKYVYPLSTERFSAKPIRDVTIVVKIKSSQAIKNIYSPSHDVSIHKQDDYTATVSMEESNVLPDKDFVLYYSVESEDVGISLLTYAEPGEDGYFILMAAPNVTIPEQKILPKDVLFVLDRTGSMQGEKIEQAKQAFEFCLRALNPKDRFNVLVFNEGVDLFRPEGLQDRTPEAVDQAVAFVRRLEATGGTDINSALTKALSMLARSDRVATIIFLTDGLPTVGETNVEKILANTKEANRSDVRLFCFGVGYDVNVHFLDKLAGENHGAPEYVRPEEDIEVAVSSLFAMVSKPILTDVKLSFSKVQVSELVPPGDLPDLFAGSQLTIFGRYRPSKTGMVEIAGFAGGEAKSFDDVFVFPERSTENDFVPRMWASAKIGYLLDEIRLHGSQKELIDEIVRLSKRYGIITEYTSYLVNEDELRRAVETHWGGGRYEDVLLRDPAFNRDDATTLGVYLTEERAKEANQYAYGAGATGQAQQSQLLKGQGAQTPGSMGAQRAASQVAGVSGKANLQVMFDAEGNVQRVQNIQQIGNKTFYYRANRWIDDELAPNQKALKIKKYSDAHFQLVDRDPQVGKLLAAGDDLIVVVNGQAIEIGEEGKENLTQEELDRIFGVGSASGSSFPYIPGFGSLFSMFVVLR